MESPKQTVVAVVTDLFFRVKVMDAAKRAGRPVQFAASLEETLDRARAGAGLVLLDLNCREFDTVEVVRRMKAEPGLATVPTLGFLSHVQEDRKREAVAAGCDRVMARSAFSDRVMELLQ